LCGGEFVHVGKRFQSVPGLRIEALKRYGAQVFSPKIEIGNNVSFGYNCHLGSINKIEIKDNVMFGSQVLVTDHQHGNLLTEELDIIAAERPLSSKGPVCIEENVWIGDNAIIMPNVTIGKNAVVGANSVVTKNVPPNSVVGGIPARVIKQL
jgi:acetyltransferase-like isoleucine patch superfamily enzyme